MASEIQQPADIPTDPTPTLSEYPLPNPDHSSVDPENPSSTVPLLQPRPPSKTYRHLRRRRPSNDETSCCGCLCQCFLTIALIAGISMLLTWLILQPKDINYYVTEATLTQFDLNNTTNTLYYDLRLNLTIQNPNKYIEIDYTRRLEVRAYYEDQWIAAVKLPRFHQGTKNTTVLSIVFNSHHDMVVLKGSRWLEDYYLEKASGVFSIDLNMYLWEKYNMRGTEEEEFESRMVCNLKVPLDSGDSTSDKASNGAFEATKCRYRGLFSFRGFNVLFTK